MATPENDLVTKLSNNNIIKCNLSKPVFVAPCDSQWVFQNFVIVMVNWDIQSHQTGAYPCFCSMKRLGIFLLLLDGMLVHRRVPPSITFASTHLYTLVERSTVRVKCLAQEHNTMCPPRLGLRPLDQETSAQTAPPFESVLLPVPKLYVILNNCMFISVTVI